VIVDAITEHLTEGFAVVDPRVAGDSIDAVKLDPDVTYLWPVFYSAHWVLAVVSPSKHEIDVYDSCRNYARGPRRAALQKVATHVGKTWRRYKKPMLRKCEQQADGSNDCGLYVIRNALAAMGLEKCNISRTGLRRRWLVRRR